MIYLLEDDDSIRKLVIYALQSRGYEARGFLRPGEFREALKQQIPDLLLLDIMLPEEDGISILRSLRRRGYSFPVIMLTARSSEYDKVEGLDAGADDYISKPFGIMELLARVRAVLRRSAQPDPVQEYRIADLYLSVEKHLVQVAGKDADLTNKEFMLLRLLLENQGRVLSREVLMDRIWGLDAEKENRTLDVHIRTLRAKLNEAGNLIQTVRGVGYRLTGDET